MDGRMKGQTDPVRQSFKGMEDRELNGWTNLCKPDDASVPTAGALMGGHVNEWHDRAGRWIDGWARRGLSDVPSVENLKSYF